MIWEKVGHCTPFEEWDPCHVFCHVRVYPCHYSLVL